MFPNAPNWSLGLPNVPNWSCNRPVLPHILYVGKTASGVLSPLGYRICYWRVLCFLMNHWPFQLCVSIAGFPRFGLLLVVSSPCMPFWQFCGVTLYRNVPWPVCVGYRHSLDECGGAPSSVPCTVLVCRVTLWHWSVPIPTSGIRVTLEHRMACSRILVCCLSSIGLSCDCFLYYVRWLYIVFGAFLSH